MSSQKIIVIAFPADINGSLTHQVRNFGEDIWREIEQSGLGDVGGIDAIDQATDVLRIHVFRIQKVGTVRKLVEKLLKAHILHTRSKVSYE